MSVKVDVIKKAEKQSISWFCHHLKVLIPSLSQMCPVPQEKEGEKKKKGEVSLSQ